MSQYFLESYNCSLLLEKECRQLTLTHIKIPRALLALLYLVSLCSLSQTWFILCWNSFRSFSQILCVVSGITPSHLQFLLISCVSAHTLPFPRSPPFPKLALHLSFELLEAPCLLPIRTFIGALEYSGSCFSHCTLSCVWSWGLCLDHHFILRDCWESYLIYDRVQITTELSCRGKKGTHNKLNGCVIILGAKSKEDSCFLFRIKGPKANKRKATHK